MGCSESKSSIATGNTITQRKKPSGDEAAPVNETKKVEHEEKVVVPQENKASEGAAGVKKVTQDAEVVSEVEKKNNAAKEDDKEKPEKNDEIVKEKNAVEEKEKPEKNDEIVKEEHAVEEKEKPEKNDEIVKEEHAVEEEKPEKNDEIVKEKNAVEEKKPEKDNGDEEVANNEAGLIKELEPNPATHYPTVAETAGTIISEESNPPEKKE